MEKMKSWKSNDPCVACGRSPSEVHHVFTRKAYPEHEDKAWNQLKLCRTHHCEIHDQGSGYMIRKFPPIKKWFDDNQWELCRSSNKWRHYE